MCVYDFGSSIINYGPKELLSMKQSGILEEIIQLNISNFIFLWVLMYINFSYA